MSLCVRIAGDTALCKNIHESVSRQIRKNFAKSKWRVNVVEYLWFWPFCSRLWFSSTATPWSTVCLVRSWITVQLSPRSPDVSGINPHHPLVSWRRWWFCLYEELAQCLTFSCRVLILHPALNLMLVNGRMEPATEDRVMVFLLLYQFIESRFCSVTANPLWNETFFIFPITSIIENPSYNPTPTHEAVHW